MLLQEVLALLWFRDKERLSLEVACSEVTPIGARGSQSLAIYSAFWQSFRSSIGSLRSTTKKPEILGSGMMQFPAGISDDSDRTNFGDNLKDPEPKS